MKGTLYKTKQGWVVSRCVGDGVAEVWEERLPLHPDDESLWMFAELNEEWKDKLDGKEVDFEIVDEFTHPELYTNVGWGDGIKYAKLIPSKEQQKELITEIMDLDAKDGLYDTVNDTVNKMAEEMYGKGKVPDYEEGFIDGFNKAKETLYTEEQVNQKMIDFAQWCRTHNKLNGETFLIEQLFSEYKSLKQPKKD